MEDSAIIIGAIVVCIFMFALGAVYGEPVVLENDCIVHNNKVYCEEVNKTEEQ